MQNILDIVGALLSFFSTFFYVLAHELCWPLGMLATIANGSLYGITSIYGDMCLEAIYFVSMIYGWYQWRRGGKDHGKRLIRRITWRLSMRLLSLSVVGIVVTFLILKYLTNSPVPKIDAVTTVLSLVAQWMICVKILECWLLWLVVDAIYIFLYFNRHLPFHSLLLCIYLGMAVVGYWRWYKLYKTQGSNSC